MKKYNLIALFLFSLATILFTSCAKDDDSNNDVAPRLTIELDHLAGLEKFYLDSTFTTANGDEFTPSLFKYYISNITLIKTDNSEFNIPESYFLVNQEDPASMKLELTNLKSGSYKAIKFLVGVDSARNVSGAQTGALSSDNGMFWDWNTGYIFFKLEGTSPAIPAAPHFFEYHIGGFSGPDNNLREVIFDFDGETLPLSINANPELHVVVDVLEVFMEPNWMNLATFSTSVVMPGPDATIIADNYTDMFTFDHIHAD